MKKLFEHWNKFVNENEALPFMVARDTPVYWNGKETTAGALPQDLRKIAPQLASLAEQGPFQAKMGQYAEKDPKTGERSVYASVTITGPKGAIVLQIPSQDAHTLRPPGPNQQSFNPEEAKGLVTYINQAIAQT